MATQSELIARNTPNVQKQFEFWVNDGSGAVKLDFAPDGWDNDEYFLQRDLQSFGVFRKFTVGELMFVKDGRDYLLNAYEAQGVNMEVTLTVLENTPSGTQRTRFVGKVDGSTAKRTELSFNCQIKDGSFTDLVLDRAKTEVNMFGTKSIDGATIALKPPVDLTIPTIEITQTAKWQGFDYTEIITSDNFTIQSEVLTSQFEEAQDVRDFVTPFFTACLNDYGAVVLRFSVEGNIQATIQPENGFYILVSFHKYDIDNVFAYIGGVSASTTRDTIQFNLTGQYNTALNVGDRVFFTFLISGEVDITYETQFTFVNYSLQSITGTIETKTVKAFLYHEAFENILHSYTGQANKFQSNALGRIDLGYSADGELGAVTGGRFLKGITGVNDTLPLSLSGLFNTINSIFCFGMGVENDILIIEPLAYFFNNTVVLDISDRIADETITKEYFPELAFNQISTGYKSFEYGRLGGIYEYNATSKFSTCLKPVSKVLDVVADYRADLSGMVTLLNASNSSTDNQNENNIFIIDTTTSEGGYIARTNEGFDEINDVIDRDQLLNLRLTPKRNLLRWGAYIRSALQKYSDKLIIWQTSDKDTNLITKETGEAEIIESADVLTSDLTAPLWHCEIFTVEVPALENDITAINANMYGLVKLTATEYGWILSYKSKNENRKSEFTLLRCNTDFVTPETSNRILTGNNEYITDLNNNYITWQINTI